MGAGFGRARIGGASGASCGTRLVCSVDWGDMRATESKRAVLFVALLLGACGQSAPAADRNTRHATDAVHGGAGGGRLHAGAGPGGASGAGPGANGGLGPAPHRVAGDIPLPPLPPPEEAAQAPRPTPSITDVAGAETALEQGFYDAVRQALPGLAHGADEAKAKLLEARLDLATGRYDEAARAAAQAARDHGVHVAAETARGEALAARGKLDDAQHAFEGLMGEPTAYRARVMLGRLLIARGHRADAEQVLMPVVDAYNDESIDLHDAAGVTYVGMAARALGAYQDANDAFGQATRADPHRVETQLEWARLFLDKHDTGRAAESVHQALTQNPNSAVGHALLARVVLDDSFDFVTADKETARALEVNPNLVMAEVTQGGMALRDMDLALADQHLDRALAVDPNDLEALSVRAAERYLADDAPGFAHAKQEVLQRNPTFAKMYAIIAQYADWEHRYPDLVAMGRAATQLDPDDSSGWDTLGMNLLRMGDETHGIDALREAWNRDHFDVQVYNTLNFYDDVVHQQYVDFDAGPFHFRMHKDEKDVLARYAPQMLERAWNDMKRRYGFTPAGPVHVELYASSQDFAIRTTGLPDAGVQGVCFGKVVTALSPAGGPFNWGQITWHELAHVFHIQLSKNHVPRWFTEGLAEYETMIARPEWKREEDAQLWLALDGGRLPPLRKLNRAFTHARTAQDVTTAYYASSMVVKYTAERFGFPKIVAMLRAWGQGKRTADVVQGVLGISIDQLDHDFRAATRTRLAARANDFTVDFARYTDLDALEQAAHAAPQDPDAAAALSAGLLVAGNADEAKQAAQAAIARNAKQPVARFVLARIDLASGDAAAAGRDLHALIAGGRDGYEVRLLFAHAAVARRDRNAVIGQLRAAVHIDPDRPEAWEGLVDLAGAANDDDAKLDALLHLARIDQHDRDTEQALLPMLAARGRWQDVVTFGEMDLYLDPENAAPHQLLAEGYLHVHRAHDALYELDTALLLHPAHPGPIHLDREKALLALGRRSDAQQEAQAATQADGALAGQAQTILRGP